MTGAVFSPFSIGRAQPGWLPARRSFERRDGRTAHPAANAPTRRDGPGALTPRLVRVARPARRGKDDRHQADVVGGTASPIDAKRGRPAAGAGRRRPGRLEAHVSRLFPARRRALATAQGPEERQGVLLQRRHEGERLGRSETRGAGDGGGRGAGVRPVPVHPVPVHPVPVRPVPSVRRHPARRQTPGRRPAPPQIGGGPAPPGGEVVRIRRPNEPATDGRARGVPAQSGGSRARPRGEEVRSARRAAGAPRLPSAHGGPFFVSGVVAVVVLSVLSSVVAWLVRSVRAVRSMRGPGGTQAAGGGWTAQIRSPWSFARWRVRSWRSGLNGPRSVCGEECVELAELVADVKSSRSGSDAFAKISCAITNAERAPELAALGRFLIATYYFNLCADKYGEYAWRWRYREYAERYGLTNLRRTSSAAIRP